jgi:hypothetical protein
MQKNVVIFSDGTGQAGGFRFDEKRSNIYKLYRATRCGPDSSIDPREQVAFYDPGLALRRTAAICSAGCCAGSTIPLHRQQASGSRATLSTVTPPSSSFGDRVTEYSWSVSVAARTPSVASAVSSHDAESQLTQRMILAVNSRPTTGRHRSSRPTP